MQKTLLLILLLMLVSTAKKYSYPEFSIDALDDNNIEMTTVMLSLPPENGFAPSVNVVKQPFSGDLKQYKAASEAQFQQLGFSLLKSEMDGAVLIMEYTGSMQGKELHWYAVAHKKGGSVFLVTATTLGTQWEKYGAKAQRCVASFKLHQ